MTPSTRTKEAIKTGLAMTIAYGIALQMDWDRPYWAAFAVAFISLPTAGQSLHKGALRMLGTLVAAHHRRRAQRSQSSAIGSATRPV